MPKKLISIITALLIVSTLLTLFILKGRRDSEAINASKVLSMLEAISLSQRNFKATYKHYSDNLDGLFPKFFDNDKRAAKGTAMNAYKGVITLHPGFAVGQVDLGPDKYYRIGKCYASGDICCESKGITCRELGFEEQGEVISCCK